MKKDIKYKHYKMDQDYSVMKDFYNLIENENLFTKEEKIYGR